MADEIVAQSNLVREGTIPKSYDGQTASFSVAVAISGLKPAVAIYMKDGDTVKNNIIGLLADMCNNDEECSLQAPFEGAPAFSRFIKRLPDGQVPEWKNRIIEYAIALKLTVRTYKLV